MKKQLLLLIGLTTWLCACEEQDIDVKTPSKVLQEQVSEIVIEDSQERANSREEATGIHFTMGYNKSVLLVSRRGGIVESLRIAFTAVEDSRCPINARCITQGAAKVQISFTDMAQSSRTVPMCIGDCGELDRLFDNEAKLRLNDEMVFELNNANYVLVLKDVTPQLVAGVPTSESHYAVEMQIKGL